MDAEVLLNELDLKKIVFKIYQKKLQVLIITLLTFIGTFLYTVNTPPHYLSSALIQVDNQLGSANSMQQILSSAETPLLSNSQASPADIEIALIKSRFILQSVIEKLGLNIAVQPHYFPVIGHFIAHHHQGELNQPLWHLNQYAWGGEKVEVTQFSVDEEAQGLNFRLQKEDNNAYRLYLPDGTLLLKGNVSETVETPPGMLPHVKIYIKQFEANPGTEFDLSLQLNDDILQTLNANLSIKDLGERSKTKTGVLQIAYEGSKPKSIPKILNTIIDFAIARNIEKKSAEASKTLDFLNRQLPSVNKSLQLAETELNLYRAKHGTIDISEEGRIALGQLANLEQHIAEVKLKQVEVLQELTPAHPIVIALKHKQTQLQKEVANIENQIRKLPITDQKALSLERDVKVKDQLYLLLLNKIQQLQVLKAGTLSDVRILSPATVPINPLPSHRTFTLFSITLLGFVISIALILMRELFQRRVDDPDHVESRLKINSFAIIPHSQKQKEIVHEMKRKIHLHQPFILARSAPKDIAIEGIRSLRTILQFTLLQSRNNMVSILGARPSIGKSFVAINLAQVLADSGKRVLLIDGDMRKGRIHLSMSRSKHPGLAELLARDDAPPFEDQYDCISKIDDNLDFIAAGDYPRHPSELLLAPRLEQLLKYFNSQYDIVVIDTPPILAVTDSVIIAKHTAVNLMVVGIGTDQMEEIELTVKRVKKNGIEIQGLVFNNKSQSQKHFTPYNYYYQYSST